MELRELWARLVQAEQEAREHAAQIQKQKAVIAALITLGKTTASEHQIPLRYEGIQDHLLADIEAIKDAMARLPAENNGPPVVLANVSQVPRP